MSSKFSKSTVKSSSGAGIPPPSGRGTSTITTLAFLANPKEHSGRAIDLDTKIFIGGAVSTLFGYLRFFNQDDLRFETNSDDSEPKMMWWIEATVCTSFICHVPC